MNNASIEDIINELSRGKGSNATRGIKILGDSPSTTSTAPTPVATADRGCYTAKGTNECLAGYISRIRFAYASDEISPDSARELDKVAAALRSEKLASRRFVVAGHTDATGSDSYNQTLSERRAASVVRYLGARGVDYKRLTAEGRGEAELFDRQNPAAPENRRVEIINLGG